MGRGWGIAGVLGVAAACAAPSLEEDRAQPPRSEPDAGALAVPEGGAPLPEASARPVGPGFPMTGISLADAGAEALPRLHGSAGWTVAVPANPPRVVSGGGPVLASPLFQSITFSNYDLTESVDDFVARIGGTRYWRQATSEYGVGPASSAPPVHVDQGSPLTLDDSTLQTWLAGQIASNAAVVAPADGVVYAVFLPSATSITFQGLQSCFTMGAYHNSFALGSSNVAYAVVPECAVSGKSTLQAATSAASHELIEAATDPLPLTGPTAYASVDAPHRYYEVLLGGGEVGDLCAQWPSSFFVPAGFPYMVQRTWSNAAAAAGLDPCQPSLPGETFFNAVPAFEDTLAIFDGLQAQPTLGVRVAVGASATIDVHLYADGDIGSWTVSASNLPAHASNLSFTWDRTTGQNGDTLHLTLKVNGVNSEFQGEPFMISSSLGSATNEWLGYVSQ
jgi:hypothetical protein